MPQTVVAQIARIPHHPGCRIECTCPGSRARCDPERTQPSVAAARARGRHGGRPQVTSSAARAVLAKKLHADRSLEIDDICKTLRISRSTFYRYVRL